MVFTGRAGAGKTTIGRGVADELRRRGRSCGLLEADAVDQHLQPGTDALVWCCALLVGSGAHAIVTTPISTRAVREQLRDAVPAFLEIFLDAPAALCTERSGRRDEGFEEPYAADLRVPTHDRDPSASTAQAMSFLEEHGVAPRDPVHPSEADRSP